MNGTYKAVYKDSNTLQHHGVKGMHWGIRRYQNADGTLTAEGRQKYDKEISKYNIRANRHQWIAKKTVLGRRTAESLGAYNRALAVDAKDKKNNSSLRNRISNSGKISTAMLTGYVGQKHLSNINSERSKVYNDRANRARTKLGTELNKSYAFNSKTQSQYHKNIANSKNVGQYLNNAYGKGLWKRPVKTWSGRKTTVGRQYVDNMLGITMIRDISYKHKNKKYGVKSK